MGLAALGSLTDDLVTAVVKFPADQKVKYSIVFLRDLALITCLGIYTRLEYQAPCSGISTPKWSQSH